MARSALPTDIGAKRRQMIKEHDDLHGESPIFFLKGALRARASRFALGASRHVSPPSASRWALRATYLPTYPSCSLQSSWSSETLLGTLGCNGAPCVRDLTHEDALRPPSTGVAGSMQPFQASYRFLPYEGERMRRACGRAGGMRHPWFSPHGTQGHIIGAGARVYLQLSRLYSANLLSYTRSLVQVCRSTQSMLVLA